MDWFEFCNQIFGKHLLKSVNFCCFDYINWQNNYTKKFWAQENRMAKLFSYPNQILSFSQSRPLITTSWKSATFIWLTWKYKAIVCKIHSLNNKVNIWRYRFWGFIVQKIHTLHKNPIKYMCYWKRCQISTKQVHKKIII